jgi:hypothetical protein
VDAIRPYFLIRALFEDWLTSPEELLRQLVVFLAVGEAEGCFVAALYLARAAGEGVVGDGGGANAFLRERVAA